MVRELQNYRPRMYCQAVTWSFPEHGWLKCNTDGACRGNPGESAHGFCIRNDQGNLVYAEAQEIGIKTNMEAETIACLNALRYCKQMEFHHILIKTDSLSVQRVIMKEWKIPWLLAEDIEEIQQLLRITQAQVQHTFREANQIADKMANLAIDQGCIIKCQTFQQLPVGYRRLLNLDKAQIATLRIRTRRITSRNTKE
ncbi:ribonuclease H-like [Solanum tuberosum]|uniref:ribonuclease H-like n=1 Tax=Solanum tuberosum TaxID=4113 RepID=UPI00073A4091|nr:PREDICTED: ribonuclease H-like [Solanum tuberosum]